MKFKEDLLVKLNTRICDDVYKMELESNRIVSECKPGQFLEVKISNQFDPLLRRPISISEINKENKILTIYYKVVGKGTKLLTEVNPGESLNGIGPLGNGFSTDFKNMNIGIVGGGIGIVPLLELTRTVKNNNNVYTFLGFNDKTYLLDDFQRSSDEIYISTVSGSEGHKGFITDILEKYIDRLDMIYACGPMPMLKKISELAVEKNIKCQVSLEERMGCGFGACLGCSIETVNGIMKKVCADGPVFWSNEVKFDE